MIEIRDLSLRQCSFALDGISFTVPRGAYGILMGRTGCGKTSLLEAVCGLKRVIAGAIVLNGRDVMKMKPAERGIGLVPQDRALFSTMTVRQHLAFAMTVRKWEPGAIARRVDKLAELLGIAALLERLPHGLSGGEAQRVALGRALSFRPSILCLDEPLSALDEATRADMCHLLRQVQAHTGVTVLHVTHSSAEAQALGDCCFELQNGKILQKQPVGA